MRAVVATEEGGPEVLAVEDVPDPIAGPGEVLIRVRACGVNRADLLQRAGRYPPPPDASPLLGLEAAGEVVALGHAARGHTVGDRVMALCNGGAYAELVAVPAGQVMPIPGGMDWTTAAAVPETFLTAWQAIRRLGGLTSGQTLLVHGAGSGVGTAAVQIGRALGCRVIATARSEAKLGFARGAGAEGLVLDGARFADRVADITAGAGVDVVCDLVGAAYLPDDVRALRRGGRVVVVGLLGGTRVELDLSDLLARHATVVGMTIRPLTREQKEDLVRDFWTWGGPLLADGTLRPLLHTTLALSRAADAHRALEQGGVTGKIVLVCDIAA